MSLCDGCQAGCCRSFAVPLSGADIVEVENSVGLDFWQFVCRWEDVDGRIARRYAPHFRFDDEPQTPFVICLRHEASRFFPATSKCRFLVECAPDAEHPHGTARCGIYRHRPSACRAFPTKLDSSGSLAILHTVPESGRPGGDGLYDLCPRPWTAADVEPISAVRSLVVAKHEMEFFRTLAAMWNRRPGAWESFPEFLRIVYSQRVQVEDEADVQDDAPRTLQLFRDDDETDALAA